MNNIFSRWITDDEIETRCDQWSPVRYFVKDEADVVDSSGCFSAAVENNKFALGEILQKDMGWLDGKKAQLFTSDYTNASGTLGEMRCYGYLLAAGESSTVEPVQTKKGTRTADFKASYKGETVIIEVNTPQMNSEEFKNYKTFLKNTKLRHDSKISISEHVSRPYGIKKCEDKSTKNKKDMTVTESVISKLGGRKQDGSKGESKQFSETEYSVLWVDLQDEYMSVINDRGESSHPILEWNGSFWSNELWYALYGEEGLPVFEGATFEVGIPYTEIEMKHQGRYNNESNIDMVIYSLPQYTVIYENPKSKKKCPMWFYEIVKRLRNFNSNGSMLENETVSLLERIENNKEKIRQFSRKELYIRW